MTNKTKEKKRIKRVASKILDNLLDSGITKKRKRKKKPKINELFKGEAVWKKEK